MTYVIVLTTSAARALTHVPTRERARIAKRIDALADNPRPLGAGRLRGGSGEHRVRVGTYRVIYTIDDGRLVVTVVRLGDRKDISR